MSQAYFELQAIPSGVPNRYLPNKNKKAERRVSRAPPFCSYRF
jgi:hypothetical protein